MSKCLAIMEQSRASMEKNKSDGDKHAANMRKFRGFLNYSVNKGKNEEKASQCKDLLQAYDAATPAEKRQMVTSWMQSGGPKANLESLLDQSMVHRKEASDSALQGHLTPGQIGTHLGIVFEMFKSTKEWEAALREEIAVNQTEYPPKKGVPLEKPGSCFWTTKFHYRHVEEERETSTRALEQTIQKKTDLSTSNSRQLESLLEQSLGDTPALEEKPAAPAVDAAGMKRTRRLNVLLDGLGTSLGKAFAQMLRQPSQEKKDAFTSIEGEFASLSNLFDPEAPLSVADFKAMEQQIKDLSSQVVHLFPSKDPSKKRRIEAVEDAEMGKAAPEPSLPAAPEPTLPAAVAAEDEGPPLAVAMETQAHDD